MTAGSVIIGDFKAGATILVRDGLSVRFADSHSDFFLSGKLIVSIEARVQFHVRPSAFVIVTGF